MYNNAWCSSQVRGTSWVAVTGGEHTGVGGGLGGWVKKGSHFPFSKFERKAITVRRVFFLVCEPGQACPPKQPGKNGSPPALALGILRGLYTVRAPGPARVEAAAAACRASESWLRE